MSRRRSARTLVLTLVTALAVPFAGGSAPAAGDRSSSVAEGAAPGRAAAVTSRCSGGPGRITMEVSTPNDDGSYPVTVTGKRLVEGSAWTVLLEWEEDAQQQRFRRTAADGTWSVTTVFTGSDFVPAFDLSASGSVEGQRRFSCFGLVVVGEGHAGGLTDCGDAAIVLLARQRDDASIGLGAALLGVHRHQRWNVRIRATAADTAQTVSFQDYTNRWGELASRVRFEGLPPDPRFRLRVSNARGAACWIRLVPGSYLTSTNSAASGDTSVQQLLRQRSQVH